jgi:hypothetical protein
MTSPTGSSESSPGLSSSSPFTEIANLSAIPAIFSPPPATVYVHVRGGEGVGGGGGCGGEEEQPVGIDTPIATISTLAATPTGEPTATATMPPTTTTFHSITRRCRHNDDERK